MTTYDVYTTEGSQIETGVTVKRAAELLQIDKAEVAAMIKEHGRCDGEDAVAIPAGEEYEPLDLDDEITPSRSVVSSKYKAKYAERAATIRKPKDVHAKAVKRSCSDWLALELAKRTLDDKAKLRVPDFEAILDANGVKHEHWNRTTKGWQGRLRMTGRLALQRVVAEADGELVLPDGSTIKAPRTWVAKHVH